MTFEKTTIEDVKKVYTDWLALKNTDFIDVELATAISPRLPGDELWMFIIAPPGGTKTETLRVYSDKKYFYEIDDLTSASFVTGLVTDKKKKIKQTKGEGKNKTISETISGEREKIKDANLNGKVLINKDFTLVLNKNSNERNAIFGQLRNLYDGKFKKKFGTLDEPVEYEAKFAVIFGVTPAIDRYWKAAQTLGERFLKCRIPGDGKMAIIQAEKMQGKEEQMRKEMKSIVDKFLKDLVLRDIEITQKQSEQLIEWADLLATLRTPVPMKNSYQEFDFYYKPEPEWGTRLVKQLKKLLKNLTIIHDKDIPDQEEMKIVAKIVLDTIPPDRLEVLRVLANAPENVESLKTIKNITNIPESTIEKIIEQLKRLNIIKKDEEWSNPRLTRPEITQLIKYYKELGAEA
ncbi:MAG: hypothetical protein KKH88_02100 [Nanoarchaeota archaeon]|nr:hypothetical protein [Nanoarchaeota archaeon]